MHKLASLLFAMGLAALLIGLRARVARFTGFGVIDRFTALTGCTDRRTDRGTKVLDKNPMTRTLLPLPILDPKPTYMKP